MYENFKNRNVLITGGLGFIGSNLSHKLVLENANITIIDNLDPRYGGNLFNIDGISESISVLNSDCRDEKVMIREIEKSDYIFHFAAQVSYIDSLDNPFEDQELNSGMTLKILEISRKYNKNVKIIFSSSRMVIGKVLVQNYDENVPVTPLSLYGIHKLTSEKYLQMYYRDFGIRSIIYRITNPYGIRQQIKHSKYSLPGWFIRQALEGKTIKIFGEGNQIRDYIYIDDLIDGILLSSTLDESNGEIFNLGSGRGTSFKNMIYEIIKLVGNGKIEHIPWPKDYENIETGDTIPSISKLQSICSFNPKNTLSLGLEKTYYYYKKYIKYYV